MNILLLSQFFSTTRGGGEYVFSLIAKKLAENNHKVWVITNRIKGEQYNVQKDVHLIFISPTLEYRGGLPPKFSDNLGYLINAIIKGLKTIKKEKIDIIHSNNYAPALTGSILSFLTSVPHVTTIHDVFSLGGKDYWKKWAEQNDVSKINAFLAPLFEKTMKDIKCKCVHTVSEATRDDLKKFGVKKPIYVIPNGIEFPKIVPTKFNRYQFVYVGRLVFYKNLEVVIRAIDLTRKTEPKIKLIIVGDGPHRKSLEDLIAKLNLESSIEFKGYVSTEKKLRLIRESNALVFPSLFEGFGLVILEAFSLAKPVLVSKIRPMSDIVSHEENGYVLDSSDEKQWVYALNELIRDPEKGTILGSNGFEICHRQYSSQTMYEKVVKMYNDIIQK